MPVPEHAVGVPLAATQRTLRDYLQIVHHRRGLLLGVLLTLLIISAVVAATLPAVYRSSATILIKEQEIPQELVRSTITSFADERIQVISQQVLTRATLIALVEKYDLYADDRKRLTSDEIVSRVRADIRLVPISADVTDRRTGSPVKSTIAFSLSFDSRSAASAQKIANDLVTLFLNENVKNRQQKAAETTSFLDDEARRMSERISELEEKLALFKRRNQGRTPDLGMANLLGTDRSEADLARVDREVAFLQDRRSQLQSQLAETRPNLPVTSAQGGNLEPEDRLRLLENQLVTLTSQYREDHPDLARVRREIASLKADAKGAVTDAAPLAIDRQAQLEQLGAEIAALRKRYSDSHPDVQRLQRTYAALEGVVREGQSARAAKPAAAPRPPDNPVFLGLRSQLAITESQIASLQAEREEVRSRLAQLSSRLSQTPEVEREFLELVRELDLSRNRFREIRDKQMQAEVAEQLERSRKAERFTIIEPPIYPEKPYRPNRQLILLMGVLLSAVAAFAAVAVAHGLDQTVHSQKDVIRVMQVPMLAVVPAQGSALSSRRRRRALLLAFAIAVTFGVLALFAIDHYLRPLDVLWYSLLRRFDF